MISFRDNCLKLFDKTVYKESLLAMYEVDRSIIFLLSDARSSAYVTVLAVAMLVKSEISVNLQKVFHSVSPKKHISDMNHTQQSCIVPLNLPPIDSVAP